MLAKKICDWERDVWDGVNGEFKFKGTWTMPHMNRPPMHRFTKSILSIINSVLSGVKMITTWPMENLDPWNLVYFLLQWQHCSNFFPELNVV